jgi:anti-anti-sigma factor
VRVRVACHFSLLRCIPVDPRACHGQSIYIVKITEQRKGDVVILRLEGSLNQGSADAVHAAAMNLVGDRVRCVIVDIVGVTQISGVGFRALERPAYGIALNGGRFAVAAASEPLKEFLSVRDGEVGRNLEFYDSADAAIHDLAQQ